MKNQKLQEKRDKIIFGEYRPDLYQGGCRHFAGLTLDQLKELLFNNFLKFNDQQNCCPPASEILAFMERYPEYTAHGYVISFERTDVRVSLEGVAKDGRAADIEELWDFINLFRLADELEVYDEMYCWFD